MKTTKTIATLSCCALAAYAIASSGADKSPVVEIFQEALGVEATGEYDDQTRSAVQAYQEENGLVVTEVPDSETLAALEVPSSLWAAVAKAAGGSEDEVDSVARAANQRISESIASSMQDTFSDEK